MPVNPWSALPHDWTSVGLPGFERNSTYQSYKLEDMPPIPIALDDEFDWLVKHGTSFRGIGLDVRDEYAYPLPASEVFSFAQAAHVQLPRAFVRFISSPGLQSRVRSCTDCSLDPGQRIVETIGSLPGHLIHFLSDSQFIAHWYLHILATGESAVLENEAAFCYGREDSVHMENPACLLEQIDVTQHGFNYCAPSFSDFLFRFWIENEIWFAVKPEKTRRPLEELEKSYLGVKTPSL